MEMSLKHLGRRSQHTKDILQNVVLNLDIGGDIRRREDTLIDVDVETAVLNDAPGGFNARHDGVDIRLTTRSLEVTLLDVDRVLGVATSKGDRAARRGVRLENHARENVLVLGQLLGETVEEAAEIAGQPVSEKVGLRQTGVALGHRGEQRRALTVNTVLPVLEARVVLDGVEECATVQEREVLLETPDAGNLVVICFNVVQQIG